MPDTDLHNALLAVRDLGLGTRCSRPSNPAAPPRCSARSNVSAVAAGRASVDAAARSWYP